MKRTTMGAVVMAAGLSVLPAGSALAQTTVSDDPNDVEAIDNPLDENDDEGFDDWGLLGLLGLLGLIGLKRRNDPYDRDMRNDPANRRIGV
jgi:hypothetical protein